MPFLDEFCAAMIRSASKRVTRTDIGKASYVPSFEQRQVMSAAGVAPQPHTTGRTIPIRVAGTSEILDTTYYPSVRVGSGREPEMRMGRGLVHWVREGDQLWLGTDGQTIFALKASAPEVLATDEVKIDEATERLFRFVDINRLLLRARASVGPPGNRETRSTVFERNPAVREVARIRSGGRCEMPGCTYVRFEKSDGTLYIEVHHVQSLARAGLDLIENVAAICPNCHAKAHYTKDRVTLEETLFNAVHAANLAKDYITPAAS